jgi:hypothetical protein
MPLLSKSEVLYLQGQKKVSKSYEYKLRSVIMKKVANLLDKEVPLLSALFPNLNLTEFGKEVGSFESQIPGSNPGRSITPSFPHRNGFDKIDGENNKESQNSYENNRIPISSCNSATPDNYPVQCNLFQPFASTLPDSARSVKRAKRHVD